MPLPEGYLPREGDEVLILAKVRFMAAEVDETIFLTVKHQKISVPAAEIHALHCRKWNEGDRISQKNWGAGTVLATHNDMVWCALDSGGGLATFDANALEPYVEPSSQSVVADDDEVKVAP